MKKPQFNSITSTDWKRSIKRARATPNDVSRQIREAIEKRKAKR